MAAIKNTGRRICIAIIYISGLNLIFILYPLSLACHTLTDTHKVCNLQGKNNQQEKTDGFNNLKYFHDMHY